MDLSTIARQPLALVREYATPLLIRQIAENQVSDEIKAELNRALSQTRVAVLPVYGGIYPQYTELLDDILQQLGDNPQISGVMLKIATPGGSVYGLESLAKTIEQVKTKKPVHAWTGVMSASAGYWIMSQAGRLSAAPNADVGSIGVWAMHVDMSRWIDEMGFTPTIISAGKYKVEGNPFEPLTQEARAQIQSEIDAAYDDFLKRVAKGRGTDKETVLAKYGEGRLIEARAARRAGMIDAVESFKDAVKALIAETKPARSRSALAAAKNRQRIYESN